MANWTPKQYVQLREDRIRYLDEIAKIEGGGKPAVEHRIMGDLVDHRAKHLARLKRNVAEIEEIFRLNGEPLGD